MLLPYFKMLIPVAAYPIKMDIYIVADPLKVILFIKLFHMVRLQISIFVLFIFCVAYFSTFSNQEPTVQEVKHEVELHLKKKTNIERTIPSSIIIGPFVVNVEALRTNLAKKCYGLAQAVLKMFAKRLHKQVEEVKHF